MSPRAIYGVLAADSAPSGGNWTKFSATSLGTDALPGTTGQTGNSAIWSAQGYFLRVKDWNGASGDASSIEFSQKLSGPWSTWSISKTFVGGIGAFHYYPGSNANTHIYIMGDQQNSSGTGLVVATSIDGVWTDLSAGTLGGQRKYVKHNNYFISAGASNRINKISWGGSAYTFETWSETGVWRCTGTDGTTVVIGDNGGTMKYASGTITSGTTWSTVTTSSFGTTGINNIVYDGLSGAKFWVAVGDAGKIAYSTTGTSGWTQLTALGSDNLYGITFHRGKWIIERHIDAATKTVFLSSGSDPSTSTWTAQTGWTSVGGSSNGLWFFGNYTSGANKEFGATR